MKRCELCKGKARMHCASDQASLCWDCDAKVHSANFLVARHSRNLLCHVCQGPTPWSASGAKLVPTASVCQQCVDLRRGGESGEEESEEEKEQEVVEENQGVPPSPPSPAECSSSIEGAICGGAAVVSGKRLRTDNGSRNLRFHEDESSSSSLNFYISPPPPGATASSLRRRKTTPMRKNQGMESGRVEACESGILDSGGEKPDFLRSQDRQSEILPLTLSR